MLDPYIDLADCLYYPFQGLCKIKWSQATIMHELLQDRRSIP